MKYNATKYVGKTIQLYPGDSVSKYGVIEDLDDLGWTIKITRVGKSSYHTDYFEVGETYFISHSKNFTFRFIED
jgi:hypothetical protein